MLKNRIYNYFFKEVFKSFFIILFALSIIAWTARAVNFLDLIIENGYSVTSYFKFTLLYLPNIVTKFIPISFLISLLTSIIKFKRQNEFSILWTSGIRKIKIINLFLYISILVLIFQLILSTFINPFYLDQSRKMLNKSELNSLNAVIKSNDFIDIFKNTTFFVGKVNENLEMENLLIRDESNVFNSLVKATENNSDVTILAKKGLFKDGKLILIDGLIQTKSSKDEIDNLNFSKTELFIDNFNSRTTPLPKVKEVSTINLFKCINQKENQDTENLIFNCNEQALKDNALENLSRRIGMPFYIPLITLILSFFVLSNVKNENNFIKKYFYFFICFIVLVVAEISVRFTGHSIINTYIYFLMPVILCPLVYLLLIFKLRKSI